MSNYNDEVVLQAFKSEINQVSTNLKSLTEERNKLEEELIHLSLTIDQREQIMEFASKIQQRIEDASFIEKCCIMDILDVQVVIHNDNQGKW